MDGDQMKVKFLHGLKENLPSVGSDQGSLYFTTDTGELYKSIGIGLPLLAITNVITTQELPNSGIQGKFYIVVTDDNVDVYVWYQDKWINLNTQGIDQDTLDLIFGFKNKLDSFIYDKNQNIVKVVTTGEVEENIDYEYDENDNIIKETIQRQNKIITNTFEYDKNNNIIEMKTVVQ